VIYVTVRIRARLLETKMKLFQKWIVPGFVLVMLVAACGPATATPTATPAGLGQSALQGAPNPLISGQVLQPQPQGSKPLPCAPPAISLDQVVPYCASQVKGLGGVSYVVHAPDASTFRNSWIGNADCNWNDQPQQSADSCTGAQNTQFQVEVCTFCAAPNAPQTFASYECATGWKKNASGGCDRAGAASYGPCPVGAYYQNDIQSCVDNTTKKPIQVCPPGFTAGYLPEKHMCLPKAAQEAFNCQYFPLTFGSCPAILKKLPFTTTQFCQNNDTGKGGVNLAGEIGNKLVVDTKGSRLDGCTPNGATGLTCWGAAGLTFKVQVCTDPSNPATCTSYDEVLGTCAPKRVPEKPGLVPVHR
jgi:hypothetical protein